ncbi:MAG: winged helix-turn-helix domain-containing protein [Phycisphaerae bacterium]
MTTKKSSKKQTSSTEKRPAKRKKIVSLAEYEADAKGGAAATAEGKPASGGKTPAKKRQPKGPRHSLANAAILVLADAKEPMNAKAIVELATENGLYKPGDGKTPEATLYSAMLRDKKARFHKADRGVWTLTDAGKAEVETIRQAFAAK